MVNRTPSTAATGQSSTSTSGPATTRTTSTARLERDTAQKHQDTILQNLITNMKHQDIILHNLITDLRRNLSIMTSPPSRNLNSPTSLILMMKSNHSRILIHFKILNIHLTKPQLIYKTILYIKLHNMRKCFLYEISLSASNCFPLENILLVEFHLPLCKQIVKSQQSLSRVSHPGQGWLLVLGGQRGEETGETDVENGLDPIALHQPRRGDGRHTQSCHGGHTRRVQLDGMSLQRKIKFIFSPGTKKTETHVTL